MKRKTDHVSIVMCLPVMLLMTMLAGCAAKSRPEKPEDSTPAIEFVSPAEPVEAPKPERPAETAKTGEPEPETAPGSEAGKQDGERFEETIMLEGMEEPVRYEHVKDLGIGFEMDYDYESLVRQNEADRERFVSVYDDPEKPQNYLEITYIEKDIDNAASSAREELSKDYDIVSEQAALDKAGSCTRLDTVSAKSGAGSPDLLETVYILPAGDGSIVATAHFTIESAEGFGKRFDHMMNTLAVIGRTAESNISEDQAVEAIKKYCFANNPDLEAMSGSDDYTIYWDVSTNETGEIVVLYRSYTGAETRYHIDPDSGKTYATELVPGIIDEEQKTDEEFNIRDYMD